MTAVLTAAVLAAALVCPAHMLWRMRRGHERGCLPSSRPTEKVADRQARLASELRRIANPRA